MKHTIALTIENMEHPVEIDIEEDTFKKIVQHCREKYPDRDWKTSNST